MPQLDGVCDDDEPQCERVEGQQELSDDEYLPLRQVVDDPTRVGGEDRDREELEGRDDTEGGRRAVGEVRQDCLLYTSDAADDIALV